MRMCAGMCVCVHMCACTYACVLTLYLSGLSLYGGSAVQTLNAFRLGCRSPAFLRGYYSPFLNKVPNGKRVESLLLGFHKQENSG